MALWLCRGVECEMGDVITIIFVSHSGPSSPTSTIWQNIASSRGTTYVQHHDWPSFVHLMFNMKATQSSEEKFPAQYGEWELIRQWDHRDKDWRCNLAWAPLSLSPTKCGDWRLVPAMNGFQVPGGDCKEKSRWCLMLVPHYSPARLQSSLCDCWQGWPESRLLD